MENFPRFNAAEHLQDEDDIAAYLTVVLEENDACAFAEALGTVARARGMQTQGQQSPVQSASHG